MTQGQHGERLGGAAGGAADEGNALQAAEQCAPQDGGWCKVLATVRLVCSGWQYRHDALAMRLLLRQDATEGGRAALPGGHLAEPQVLLLALTLRVCER
jgi:hypothetical protein